MFQVSLWSLPPLAAFGLVFATWARTRVNRDMPGMSAFRYLCLCVAWWSASQFIDSLLTAERPKTVIVALQYVAMTATPVAWFVFAVCYTRHRRRLQNATLFGLALLPAITLLLLATNAFHGLVWSNVELVTRDGVAALNLSYGPWFIVHAVYGYGLVFAATVILAFNLSQSERYRRPLVAVITAPALCTLLSLVYLSPWNPTPGFDPTPLGFAFAALILNDGLLRFGLLDLIPVMRHQVVEELTDGIIIVDNTGRIIDINSSAIRDLAPGAVEPLNRHISELVESSAFTQLIDGTLPSAELLIGDKAFDVKTTELGGASARRGEVALVFRDLTVRRQMETRLLDIQQELERLAHTDSLTGLHNRRYFMQRLREETERLRRHGTRLSVVLFDLDNFKRVNDTYGHDAGDRVLQVIADIVVQLKRALDVAARLGGEEFAILLPETERAGALALAQRLRSTIEAQQIPDVRGRLMGVTVSVGVATAVAATREYDHLLISADQALYRAKNQGRNQVCYFE